jgi:hypothetical protein
MSAELEFHDSTISEIGTEGGDVVVRLRPAYVRVREADGSLAGYSQSVDLRFRRAGSAPQIRTPVWISEGKMKIGRAVVFDSLMPLPHASSDGVQFSAQSTEGEAFQIVADGCTVEAVGDREFVERIE